MRSKFFLVGLPQETLQMTAMARFLWFLCICTYHNAMTAKTEEQETCNENVEEIKSVIARAFGENDASEMIRNVYESPYDYLENQPPIIGEFASAVIMETLSKMTRPELYNQIIQLTAGMKKLNITPSTNLNPTTRRFPTIITCNLAMNSKISKKCHFHIMYETKHGIYYSYRRLQNENQGDWMYFSYDGSWLSRGSWGKGVKPTNDCEQKSINQLTAEKRTYNFIDVNTMP